MKNKKLIIGLVSTMVVVMLLSATYIIIQIMKDNDRAKALSIRFNKSITEVKQYKQELKDWAIVEQKLLGKELGFSNKEASKLYYSGYLLDDIKKAQELSVKSGVSKLSILKARGIYPKIISWEKVIKKLKLDLRDDAEKFGLSKAEVKYFKDKGYSEIEIIQISLIVLNHKDNIKNIKLKLNEGKSVEELNKDYGLALGGQYK